MSDMDPAKRETRRQRIKLQKRRRLIALALALLVVALVIFGLVKLAGLIFKPRHGESANVGPTPPAEGAAIVITTPPKYYDYSSPVPEADAAEDAYFQNCLFIGDSRTTGLSGYISADILSSGNISVDVVDGYTFDFGSDTTTTLVDQLAVKQYDAVYIMLGLNELGWENSSAFDGSYRELVETVRSLAPDTSVYLQSVIPVTSAKSGSPSYLTNERIAEYNTLIRQIAVDRGVFYLDVTEVMSNRLGSGAALPGATDPAADPANPAAGNGAAAGGDTVTGIIGGHPTLSGGYAASDGYHLTGTGYDAWVGYLKTHVVDRSIYAN